MQYIERTMQVKEALLKRLDLLERVRAIFASHHAQDGKIQDVGRGNTRTAYEVGECEVAEVGQVNLLLKLYTNLNRVTYTRAAQRSETFCQWYELGAFEMYYDFVAGNISTVTFRSEAGYQMMVKKGLYGLSFKKEFTLSERWGGTQVNAGDLGAVPYFQMVVRHKRVFGVLTEGLPPLIEPQMTAYANGYDDNTVEQGRIIDLGRTHCCLIHMDCGGTMISFVNRRYPNNLGVRLRGRKYFFPANRLDL